MPMTMPEAAEPADPPEESSFVMPSDDGFDDLYETADEVPELSQEEKTERTQSRLKLAFGAGNLFGVIAGTVLILVLLTLIFSMIHFVITDMGRNFSLFQTNF